MTRFLTLLMAAVASAEIIVSGGGDSMSSDKSSMSSGNSMSSMSMPPGMQAGSSQNGCMVTQWMAQGGSWNKVNSAMSYSSNSKPMTHQVTVGGSAGLVYTPPSITANVGDIVQFNFMSKNHTVTQSSFNSPCVALGGTGLSSGFMANAMNSNPPPAVQMQVTVSTPLWFYCQQTGHCGMGMAFSINPTATKSQDMFVSMAKQQNGTSSSMSSSSSSSTNNTSSSGSMSSDNSSPSSSVVMGSGTLSSSGSCNCQCLCGTNSYAPGLGVGMMNGLSGMMPSSMSQMSQPEMGMPAGSAPSSAPSAAPSDMSGMSGMSSDMSSGSSNDMSSGMSSGGGY